MTAVCDNKKKSILLVDKDACIRFSLGRLLVNEGYSVLTASNSMKAIDLYSEHPDSIDLILMGIDVPVQAGSETYNHLSELQNHVSIVVISHYSRESLETLQQLPFFRKPVYPDELLTSIKEILA